MNLADVADELYGLLPGDFTAERNQRAKDLKADGDGELAAQVKALAKPTSAAWLVNQLVRHHHEEVEQVAQVGAALRAAQEGLDRDQLMALNKQRHLVLRAVTQQARALARDLGQPVSTAVADEVEQTLRAVMSDSDAADAVRTGTLRRSLSGTGLGPVDLTDAVALHGAASAAQPGRRNAPTEGPGRGGTGRPGSGPAAAEADAPTPGAKPTRDELAERRRQHQREQKERERQQQELERQHKALAEARRQAEEADERAAAASEALDRAQESVDELADRQERLVEELRTLEQRVKDTRNRLDGVQRDAQAAQRERDDARHESEVARRAADRAQQRLERLS
jgi:hypothetical protein